MTTIIKESGVDLKMRDIAICALSATLATILGSLYGAFSNPANAVSAVMPNAIYYSTIFIFVLCLSLILYVSRFLWQIGRILSVILVVAAGYFTFGIANLFSTIVIDSGKIISDFEHFSMFDVFGVYLFVIPLLYSSWVVSGIASVFLLILEFFLARR